MRQLTINLALGLGLTMSALPSTGIAMGNTASLQNETIALSCTGAGDAALHSTLCAEFQTVMAKTFSTCRFSGAAAQNGTLNLALDVTKASDTAITARLRWSGAARGAGQPLTVGIRGKPLGPRQFEQLINSLLKTTKLPFSSC